MLRKSSALKALVLCLAALGAAAAFASGQDAPPPPQAEPAPEPFPTENYLVGAEVCGACHGDKYHQFSTTPHMRLLTDPRWKPAEQGCEACHGPGGFHTHYAGDPAYIFNLTCISPDIRARQSAGDGCRTPGCKADRRRSYGSSDRD